MEEYYYYCLKMYIECKKYWFKVYYVDYWKFKNQYCFIMEIIDNKMVVN